MDKRIEVGLVAIIALEFASGASTAKAQTRSDSPPWRSDTRILSTQLAPAAMPSAAPKTAYPHSGSPGGPLSPLSPQQAKPQLKLPSGPALGGWQRDAQPRPASVESTIRSLAAGRRIVAFTAAFPVGSIVVVNRERALYHVGTNGTAIRYPVAIGTLAEEWTGLEIVTDKKVNPAWHPVIELGKEIREPVQGGDPANPLGVRALYLGRTLWRIHGTPAAESIGQPVSNGCIRMHNIHVVELYDQVMLGTEVYVVDRLSDLAPDHRGRKVIQ